LFKVIGLLLLDPLTSVAAGHQFKLDFFDGTTASSIAKGKHYEIENSLQRDYSLFDRRRSKRSSRRHNQY